MRCPDCGAALSGIPLALDGSVGGAYRCSRCGGWFMSAKMVNDLTYTKLLRHPRMGIDSRWMTSRGDRCPNDNEQMQTYHGDSVPEGVRSFQCPICKWWWFPTDDLYTYKEALEAKLNYMRLWGSSSRVSGLVLPLVALIILAGGLGIGIKLSQRETRPNTQASMEVSGFSTTVLGNGQVTLTFKSNLYVNKIYYRVKGSSDWMTVNVVKPESVNYVVNIGGLVQKTKYEVQISKQMFEFDTN